MKRSRQATRKVELLRSFVGKEREYFEEVFEHQSDVHGPDSEHVLSREIVTTHVSVPNQVSDNPAEVALKS